MVCQVTTVGESVGATVGREGGGRDYGLPGNVTAVAQRGRSSAAWGRLRGDCGAGRSRRGAAGADGAGEGAEGWWLLVAQDQEQGARPVPPPRRPHRARAPEGHQHRAHHPGGAHPAPWRPPSECATPLARCFGGGALRWPWRIWRWARGGAPVQLVQIFGSVQERALAEQYVGELKVPPDNLRFVDAGNKESLRSFIQEAQI